MAKRCCLDLMRNGNLPVVSGFLSLPLLDTSSANGRMSAESQRNRKEEKGKGGVTRGFLCARFSLSLSL